MTRYRPIHVQALFLGAATPADDREYLYSAQGEFAGQGVTLLRSLAVESAGRTVEATLTDFQRRGYLLAVGSGSSSEPQDPALSPGGSSDLSGLIFLCVHASRKACGSSVRRRP